MNIKADFFVSPWGHDEWSGKLPEPSMNKNDGPFETLERAKSAVKELKAGIHGRDITVMIRGGTYRLEKPVIFNLDDSASNGCTVTYAAYPGEMPVFSSGVPVKNWKKVHKLPSGFVKDADGKLWEADVSFIRDHKEKNGLIGENGRDWRFFTLYSKDGKLERSSTEGFSTVDKFQKEKIVSIDGAEVPPEEKFYTLKIPEDLLKSEEDIQSAEIRTIPKYDFVMNLLEVKDYDKDNAVLHTAMPSTYVLEASRIKFPNTWIENVRQGIDRPGRWFLSVNDKKLYYWPKRDIAEEDIYIPLLVEMIKVEGEINERAQEDIPVRGIVFEGLSFTHSDRFRWRNDHKGWGLQHDWDMYDSPSAFLRFRGAEDCVVKKCSFVHGGSGGIRLDLHCKNIRIIENEIGHVGSTGILLSGYGAGKKDVNKGNLVHNNYIHHGGEEYWQAPGIFVTQSGDNRVTNNLIHDFHYNGITVSGYRSLERDRPHSDAHQCIRWYEIDDTGDVFRHPDNIPYRHARNNLFERNEVFQVMKTLADGNGIYISGAGEGNVFRANYVHHISGRLQPSAIRTDACQRGTLFTQNVIYKCTGYGFILKDVNHVINNYIIDTEFAVQVEQGVTEKSLEGAGISFRGGPTTGLRVERNVFYYSGHNEPVFYEIRRSPWLPEIQPDKMTIDSNIFYSANNKEPECVKDFREKYKYEQNSLACDPLFLDVDKEDFRLDPGSPAMRLGIESIDVRKAGLEGNFREIVNGSPFAL